MRAYMQVAPRATPVQPTRVYSNTQQIHARRETRARFDPNSLEAKQSIDLLVGVTI